MSGSNIAAGFQTPAAPNMLQQLGQVAGIANALNTNRRETETFQAQQQVGRALQGSMNPQTGEVDHNSFRAAIADNPMAAFLAPQALAQARALQMGTLQIQQQQAVVGMQRLNNLRQTLGGLLANPNVSRDEVVSSLGSLLSLPENERPFSPTVAAAALSTLPTDPSQLRPWLLRHMLSTDQGIAHAQNFLPRQTIVGTGGQQNVLNTDPISGRVTQAPGQSVLPMTPTPGERNDPLQDIDPTTGRPRVRPRQDALPMVDGQGRPLAPGQSGGSPPSPFGTGRPPSPTPGVTPPVAPVAPSPVVGQAPQAQTGWAPGEAEARNRMGVQAGEDAAQLVRAAQGTRDTEGILQNLDALVQQFASGPTADWQRVAGATWNRVMPSALQADPRSGFGGFSPQAIASQEEFNKQTFALAAQQFRDLGGTGTDNQLSSVMNTSPNEAISRMGNRGIIALLRGNTRALEVKAREWQEWQRQGNGAETYHQFTTEFNRRYDPRVFQSLFMTTDMRRQMWERMNETDREAYTNAWRSALERGWVQAPGRPAAGGAR